MFNASKSRIEMQSQPLLLAHDILYFNIDAASIIPSHGFRYDFLFVDHRSFPRSHSYVFNHTSLRECPRCTGDIALRITATYTYWCSSCLTRVRAPCYCITSAHPPWPSMRKSIHAPHLCSRPTDCPLLRTSVSRIFQLQDRLSFS